MTDLNALAERLDADPTGQRATTGVAVIPAELAVEIAQALREMAAKPTTTGGAEEAIRELERLRNAKWSDLSDGEMGRCFKAFAQSVETQTAKDYSGDEEMRLGLMQIGLFQAIKMAAESNAGTFTFRAEGFRSDGVEHGDWAVEVSRIAKPIAEGGGE